jgi:hypothetical protein
MINKINCQNCRYLLFIYEKDSLSNYQSCADVDYLLFIVLD